MKIKSKLFFLLALSGVLQCCCSDEDVIPHTLWSKIEFPDQGSIYGIYGAIEDGMLLSTSRAIIKLSDNGTTTTEVLQVDHPIINFIEDGNVIHAVSNFNTYFSIDKGDTWQDSDKSFSPWHVTVFRDSKDVIYHHVSLANGELTTPSLIMKSSDNGTNWEDIFPFKHYIYSVHLDAKDRLYVGTNSWEWDGLSFTGNTNNAILYFVRR